MADKNGDSFDNPVNPIPGAKYVAAVTEIWSRTMTEYASAYNRSWSQLQTGAFSPGDLMKSMTQAWRSQYQAVQDLLAVPFRGYEASQWRYFHFDKTEQNSLVESVQLSTPQGLSATLKATPLHIFSPGNTSIDGSFTVDWEDGRRGIEIRFDPDKLKGSPSGLYLGFVYNGSAASGEPLVFILLQIA
jgi:hypothetical protein